MAKKRDKDSKRAEGAIVVENVHIAVGALRVPIGRVTKIIACGCAVAVGLRLGLAWLLG